MEEFARGAKEEGEKVEVMRALDLCLMPCVTTRHIVFALCTVKGSKMVRALKLKREPKKDALFVTQMMASFNVRPIK
jgi:hypothetical protein